MATEVEIHEEAFADLMANEVTDDLVERGDRVAEAQRDLINDRSGRLSRSIAATKPELLGDDVALAVGTDVFYAGFVNDGTRYADPVPFVEPSAIAAR